jgi:hypothetical protein
MMAQSMYNLLRSLTEAEQVEFVDRYVTDAASRLATTSRRA